MILKQGIANTNPTKTIVRIKIAFPPIDKIANIIRGIIIMEFTKTLIRMY